MAVLSLLRRTSLRRGWRSWLFLGLLIALVSGLVLAAVTVARRTSSAFPQYEAVHGYDAFLASGEACTCIRRDRPARRASLT